MIYGYNSKLLSNGIDMIMDYGRELMEEIKKVRNTEEVRAVMERNLQIGNIRLTFMTC